LSANAGLLRTNPPDPAAACSVIAVNVKTTASITTKKPIPTILCILPPPFCENPEALFPKNFSFINESLPAKKGSQETSVADGYLLSPLLL
jgi:hypothetical protein